MSAFTIPVGYEARATCHVDPSRSRFLTDHERPLQQQLSEIGVTFGERETRWVEEHRGAEDDHWLVRIVECDEPLIEGVERRP